MTLRVFLALLFSLGRPCVVITPKNCQSMIEMRFRVVVLTVAVVHMIQKLSVTYVVALYLSQSSVLRERTRTAFHCACARS